MGAYIGFGICVGRAKPAFLTDLFTTHFIAERAGFMPATGLKCFKKHAKLTIDHARAIAIS
jgi:hypothetical protein